MHTWTEPGIFSFEFDNWNLLVSCITVIANLHDACTSQFLLLICITVLYFWTPWYIVTRILIVTFCLFAVFYVSFVITPICSNASELVSSLMFAAKKTKINSSLTFSQVHCPCVYAMNKGNVVFSYWQLYGAATMNNTLGLGIFAALVYFRDLEWQYSAGKYRIHWITIDTYCQ